MISKIHTCHWGLVQPPASGEEQLSSVCHALIDQCHEQQYHPFGRFCRLGPQGFWIKFSGKFLVQSLCEIEVCWSNIVQMASKRLLAVGTLHQGVSDKTHHWHHVWRIFCCFLASQDSHRQKAWVNFAMDGFLKRDQVDTDSYFAIWFKDWDNSCTPFSWNCYMRDDTLSKHCLYLTFHLG